MLSFRSQGLLAIREQLAILRLDPQKRKRLINRALTRGVRVAERKRIRNQTDLSGQAFSPRKHKKKGQKAKMLTGLAKRLVVTKLTPDYGVLGFADRKTGMIARAHNDGQVTTGNAAQLAHYRNTNPNKPATKEQIRRLKLLNYQIPAGKGRFKRPSAQWLAQNMTFNRAGLTISLIEKANPKPRSWQIKTPSRSFNGVSQSEQNQLITTMLNDITNAR